jgi:hypothetical protein
MYKIDHNWARQGDLRLQKILRAQKKRDAFRQGAPVKA